MSKALTAFLEGQKGPGRIEARFAEPIEMNGQEFTRQALIERLAQYVPGEIERDGRGGATFSTVVLSKTDVDYLLFFREYKEIPASGPVVEGITGAMVKHLTCLCGCGEPTTMARSRFRAGHDARLKSVLLDVAREVQDESAIPAIAIPFVDELRASMLGNHDLTPVEAEPEAEDEDESDEG